MAEVKGGAWKATNDKNGVGTLSYTIGSQTVAKIAGLATLTQNAGGSIYVVDPTTGETNLLSDGVDYGIYIEPVLATAEGASSTVTSYTGTIKLSQNILGTSKLTLTNGKYKLDSDDADPDLVDDTVFKTSKLKISLPDESKVKIAKGTENLKTDSYNKSKGTLTVTGNLTGGYAIAKDGLTATYQAFKSGQTVATISGLRTGLTGDDWKSTIALTAKASENSDSDGGYNGLITLSKLEKAAESSDGEPTYTTTGSVLGNTAIKVTTNATLANNGTNYYLGLSAANKGKHGYAQGELSEYENEAKWTINKTTATYKIDLPVGYQLANAAGETIEGNENATIADKATQIKVTAEQPTTIATVKNLLSGLKVSEGGKSVGVYSKVDLTSDGVVDEDDFLTGLTADFTLPTSGSEAKGEVAVKIGRNALPTTKATVQAAAGGLFSLTGGEVALEDSYGTVPTVKPDPATNENDYLDIWVISGTTATLKRVSSAYYTLNGNKIASVAQTTGQVLATIKNLNKEWLADENNLTRVVIGNANTPITEIKGIKLSTDYKDNYEFKNNKWVVRKGQDNKPVGIGTITLSNQVLTTKSVTIGTSDNFKLFVRQEDDSDGGLSAVSTPSFYDGKWNLSSTTATYKGGISAGYIVSNDGKTITYTAEGTNQTLATITGLKKGVMLTVDGNGNRTIGYTTTGGFSYGIQTTFDNSDDSDDVLTYYDDSDPDKFNKLNKLDITLSRNVLDTTKVAITSNFFKLAIDKDASDEDHFVADSSDAESKVDWHGTLGTNATLRSTREAYYTVNDTVNKWGQDITYTAPATGGTTLAIVKGLNSGITKDDISFDTISGAITIENENAVTTKSITLTGGGYSQGVAESLKVAGKFYLALGESSGLSAPVLGNETWTQATTKGNPITFKAEVTEGYQVSSDSMAINYTAESTTPKVLASITGLKGGLTRLDGSDSDSVQFAGVSFSEETGVITLGMQALNDATVTLTNSNYSLSMASDVPKEAGESGQSWVISGTTATYKNVGGNAYYSIDKNTLKYNPAATPVTSLRNNYVTINGLKSGLTVSNNGQSIGYYNAGGSFITAITIETLGSADSITGGKLTIVDENALTTGNVKIDTNPSLTSGSFSIGLGASLAQELSAQLQIDTTTGSAYDPTWSITNKGVATYKGRVQAYYTNDTDNKGITYHAANNNATIATITNLATTLGSSFKADGNVVSANGSASGLVVNDDTREIAINRNMLGTSTLGAVLTTNIAISGASAYKFKLGSNVMTYAGVSSQDDAVWVIANAKNATSTTATRSIWTQAHYELSGNSTTLTYKPTGVSKELAKIDGLAKGLGTIKGGEINGLSVAGTSSTGLGLDTGVVTFLTDDVIISKKDVVLTDLDSSDGIDYSLAIGEGSKIKTITPSYVYKIGGDPSNDTVGTIMMYHADSEGYSLVDGNVTVTTGGASATLTTSTLKYNKKTNNTDSGLLVQINGLKKISELKQDTVATGNINNPTRIDGFDGITFDRSTGIFKVSNKVLTASNVTARDIAAASLAAGFSLALDEDVPAPLANGPGWKVASITGSNGRVSTVPGSFELYANCSAPGYTVSSDHHQINYVEDATGAADQLGASISGLASNLAINSYQIAGISIAKGEDSNPSIITLSKGVLASKDVTLENLNSGNYKLAIVSDSAITDKYVAPPSVSAVWNYNNGTATYMESMKEGYELSGDSMTLKYTPTTTVTSTLTNLSKDGNVNLYNKNGDTVASGGMSISGISFAGGVFTITSKDVLANKKVTLTVKDSKNKNVDGYKLALGGGVGASLEPLTWNKTETDTKATLTQVTKSGYTVSTDGKAINYSSDPTTATLMTITGLKKANVSASAVNDDNDYAATIKGIVIGSFSDTGSESAIGHDSAYSLASAFAPNASGGYVKISKDVLTNTNVTLGKNDNYKLVLDADDEDSVPTAAEESQAWSVNKTTATYKNIKTPYYTLTNDKTITYKAASIGSAIVAIGGLRSGLTPNAAGSIAGIEIDSDYANNTTVTLSAEALPTDAGTVTISSDYALDLAEFDGKVDAATSIAAGVVTITAEGTTRESVNAWVEEGSNYVYRLYNPGYYTLGKTNATVKVNNKITSTAAKTLVKYFTITGLSAGMSLSDDNITFNDNDDHSKGGVINIDANMLDDKTVKLTSNYNFKLSVEGGVSAANLSFADNPWNIKGTNATLKGTYGKGYALSEDGKTLTYYSKDEGTTVNLATLTGLKSSAPLDKDVLGDDIDEFSATEADSVINITLDKTQLGTTKVALKGDHFQLAVSDAQGKIASQTDDPTWIKANNATTATYTQTTYAGFSPSADGKTLNYLSKTTPVNLVTITGLNKALTIDDMVGGESDALDEVEKAIELNETDKTIAVSASAVTTANMTLGKNDAYKFVFKDIERDYINPKITYDGKGTAQIKNGHTASYTQTNDKTITYAKETSSLLASISNLPKTTTAGLSLGTGDDSLQVTIDTRALSKTATAAKLTNASKNTTYELVLATTGANSVPTAQASNPKWTNYDAAKGKATLKSVMTEGYTLGKQVSLTSGASKGAMTQTVSYTAEKNPADLTTISGLPKNALELKNGELYMKGTKAEAFTFGTGAASVQVTASDSLLSAIADKKADTTLKLSGGTGNYVFANNDVTSYRSSLTSGTKLILDSVASGKVIYGNPTAANLKKSDDSKEYTYTPDKPGTIFTINGLATTTTGDDVTADATAKQVTVKAGALTNSKVTFTYPTTTSEKYEFVLDSNVYTTGQHEDQWKNQVDWVTSGGTATYKLYNKANYTLATVKGSSQITYVAPTKGSAFAAISGLNKTTASITSADVGGDGVISLTAEDLNASKVTLNITNVKTVSDSIVAASIETGNTTAGTFTLTLTDNVVKSTVSNEYWDTTNTTAKLTGSISEGYRLATNKKSVLYYSKNADGQTIATITGLKKNAEIATTDYDTSSDDPFITNVSLGSDQLTTTKVAIKGEGYKLVLKDEVLDQESEWKDKVDWFASNGTFTYKTYNRAHYTANTLGTEITYTAQKDVQQHAVIAGLNKTVTSASLTSAEGTVDKLNTNYASLGANNVITIQDAALNKAKITLTDKDLGGYTLALENTASLSTATVDAAISGTGNAIKATWKGTQGAGYLLGNDAQSFTYIDSAKAATVAVVTGLASDKTADDLSSNYNTTNNVVTLAASDLNTVKKATTLSGTAAFSFSDDVDGYTLTGSAAADRVTIAGDNNVFNAAAGNDWIEISGAANSINAGAGNDRILVGSANNLIVAGDGSDRIILSAAGNTVNAGKGADYIDLGSGKNTFFYANGDGADVIAHFKEGDTFKVTNLAKAKISISDSGSDAIVKVNGTSVKLLNAAKIGFKVYDSTGKDENAVTHAAATPNILADDNYSMTPQLSSIVKGSTTYMTDDLVATDATSLTKQSTAIAYSGKK